jgi:hypothetical protein
MFFLNHYIVYKKMVGVEVFMAIGDTQIGKLAKKGYS